MSTDLLLVPAPSDPMAVARAFVLQHYMGTGGVLLLRHHRNTFLSYDGTRWCEDDEGRVRSQLWRWLESACYANAKGEICPFEPTKYKITNVIEALKAIGHVPESVQPPVWLDASGTITPINAGEIITVENGIFEFGSRTLQPHTPELFSLHCLPFAYDSDAPEPGRWLRFLDEIWGDDVESKQAIQEIFGYTLSDDTSQQKMFLVVGPKRSGKGTIARVLTGIVGAHNTAAPTLAGLTQNFGLQPLIGKPLATISDARLGARADNMIAVERLLSISGEDTITIDRKYRDPWTGKLPTRFVILTNELPRFADSSGALASRFVMLTMTRSFYGKENPGLTAELLAEAPAIFNWGLEGLDRLRERGYFVSPTAAREAQRHLEDLASPVGAFVRDRCHVQPELVIEKDALWTAWKTWCQDEGIHPSTKTVFARDLRASVPRAVPGRPRVDGKRIHVWTGIGLADPQSDETPDHPDRDDLDELGQGGQGYELFVDPQPIEKAA